MITKQRAKAIKSPRKVPQAAPVPEAIVNDAPRHFADADWPVGTAAHQGDVILVRIAALPAGAVPRANRQVAEGTTQGSRHVLDGGAIYTADPTAIIAAIQAVCPRSAVQPQYAGPVFVTDTTTILRHPEHGDHVYDEAGLCVAVVFQRNLDAEQREVRTRD